MMENASDQYMRDVQVSQTRSSLDRAKDVSKVEVEGFLSRDDHEMALLGKKQQLRV